MRTILLIAVLTLGGCAHNLAPGAGTEADVLAHFGKPVDSRKLDGGMRQFDYPRGPLGRETWRFTFEPDGRIHAIEQLLDEPHFAQLKSGMPMEAVRFALGRHYLTTDYANLDEQVWSWRYTDFGSAWMFFNAHFDAKSGLLKYTSRTPELIPEIRGRRRH